MEFKEVTEFLKLKEKADKRAEEVFNLLCELKEFNVSWFMNLSGITYEDGCIWYECSGRCRNEYEEEHKRCGIEYLYTSDEEITKQIKDKQEKERKQREEQKKETARRIAETKEKQERAEYERLKAKYDKGRAMVDAIIDEESSKVNEEWKKSVERCGLQP